MTLQQLYPIIQAMVAENEALAFRALEDLVGETASEIAHALVEVEDEAEEDVEAQQQLAPQLDTMAEHGTALPAEWDDVDLEAAPSPVRRRLPEALHGMAPPPKQ